MNTNHRFYLFFKNNTQFEHHQYTKRNKFSFQYSLIWGRIYHRFHFIAC